MWVLETSFSFLIDCNLWPSIQITSKLCKYISYLVPDFTYLNKASGEIKGDCSSESQIPKAKESQAIGNFSYIVPVFSLHSYYRGNNLGHSNPFPYVIIVTMES